MVRATDFYSEEDYNAALDEEAAANSPHHWANDFASYEEACHYYGADSPASLAGEDAFYEALARDGDMDAIEARGGPAYSFVVPYDYGDIPF